MKRVLEKITIIILGLIATVMIIYPWKFIMEPGLPADARVEESEGVAEEETNAEYIMSEENDDSSSDAETSCFLENGNFYDMREYHDGLAFVRISVNGESYKGFLDKTGNLKFYVPLDEDVIDADVYRYDVNFDNGYNWFVYNGVFYVIDTEGKLRSQYDADLVADYGGGYTWIEHEEDVSWENAGYWRYTLYSPDGKEVFNYTINNTYLSSGNWSFGRKYMGDGVFLYEKMDEEKNNPMCILCEPQIGRETELTVNFDKASKYGMRDGIIATTGALNDGYWASDENPFHMTLIGNGQEKEIEIPSAYLGPFGSYPKLLDWSENYALFTVEKNDQDIYFVCNLKTLELKQYTGKYAQYLRYYSTTDSCIEDDILALSMVGADNIFYVCLINADTMEEIADPIMGEEFSMVDNALLVEQLEIYDLSGNLLFTVDDEKKGKTISDETLQVTYTEEETDSVEVDKVDYYNLKGNKLFSSIDASDSKMLINRVEKDTLKN